MLILLYKVHKLSYKIPSWDYQVENLYLVSFSRVAVKKQSAPWPRRGSKTQSPASLTPWRRRREDASLCWKTWTTLLLPLLQHPGCWQRSTSWSVGLLQPLPFKWVQSQSRVCFSNKFLPRWKMSFWWWTLVPACTTPTPTLATSPGTSCSPSCQRSRRTWRKWRCRILN